VGWGVEWLADRRVLACKAVRCWHQ
jgi:hypothetical protein